MEDEGHEQWLDNGRVRAGLVLVVIRRIDSETRFFEPINAGAMYTRAIDGIGDILETPVYPGGSIDVTRKLAGPTEMWTIRNENGRAKCQNITTHG